jgi:hypothetical protein
MDVQIPMHRDADESMHKAQRRSALEFKRPARSSDQTLHLGAAERSRDAILYFTNARAKAEKGKLRDIGTVTQPGSFIQ